MDNRRVTDPPFELNERFRQAVESLPQLIWMADAAGLRTYVSPRWMEYTGCPETELLGLHWLEYLHPNDRERVRRAWEQAIHDRAPYNCEYRLRGRDGIYRWFKARAASLRDNAGQIQKWVGSSTDIDDVKRAEAQLYELNEQIKAESAYRREELRLKEREVEVMRRLEILGQLTGGVAHDFRNLMTGILALVGDVKEEVSAPDLKADLEEVMKAAQRASDLTRQLLSFGGGKSGGLTDLCVNEAIRDLTALCRHTVPENIVLKTDLEPGVGAIRVNRQQFDQVFLNLIVNARDAMPEGGSITIRSSLAAETAPGSKPQKPSGGYVRIEVADTGCGMAPETQRHIFEPFFTTKAPDHGTGMGLATVDTIVKRHGGAISVESRVGQGTVFRLDFPRSLSVPIPRQEP